MNAYGTRYVEDFHRKGVVPGESPLHDYALVGSC